MTELRPRARDHLADVIDAEAKHLHALNLDIHSHPETAYEEVHAHDALLTVLECRGYTVQRHAYGLETSFEAEAGSGGRIVVVCCEYDALPGIGHGCGHNLIATSSMAGFLGLVQAVRETGVAGRVRILGTPAEEGGGGKERLIQAGAFDDKDIAAAIMAHPISSEAFADTDGVQGIAGFGCIASHKLRVEYHGSGAHAAGDPWTGLNALDAAVAAYVNISMLRQQIQPDERIHGIIEDGGRAANVIPDYTRMSWNIRSPNIARADELLRRAKACFEAASAATGCTIKHIPALSYKDLKVNRTLSELYSEEIGALKRKVTAVSDEILPISTDMGNVSQKVPGFHGTFGIPTDGKVPGHHPDFAKAAGTEEAHREALLTARGMSMMGWIVLADPAVAESVWADFSTAK